MALRLVLIGRAFVSEMVLGATDHAEVVLAMTFLFFREELSVWPQDLR